MNYELIIEQSRNPSNFGKIDKPTVSFSDSNPLCGDSIKIDMDIEENKVVDIKFSGIGCSVCMASASKLTELVKGQKIDDAIKINKDGVMDNLGLEGVSINRMKCVMLSISVFGSAIKRFNHQ